MGIHIQQAYDMTDLDDLLLRTSRTFAMSIPLLPEPTRQEVKIAYLLFRVADTLEDADLWGRGERIAALDAMVQLLHSPTLAADALALTQQVRLHPPSVHEGYVELLLALPELMAALESLEQRARATIILHALRTAEGMRGFVERQGDNGSLVLRDVEDLKDYCYVVAGIVGEMLTELFLLQISARADLVARLRRHSRAFGEGLQLVNILKDAEDDHHHGRVYLPAEAPREAIFELARQDLRDAVTYIRTLQDMRAPRGIVEFNALNVRLAFATVDQVEVHGAGAKLSRAEVARIFTDLGAALDDGRPAL
jgi:farnesyl-diphosphate farnesyltransferase